MASLESGLQHADPRFRSELKERLIGDGALRKEEAQI